MQQAAWYALVALRLLNTTGAVAQAQPGAPAGNGLRAEYYQGEHFEQRVHGRSDPLIDFYWDGSSPAPGVSAENFSVRWTGYLYAPTTGVYTFHVSVDDGMRVWLNGRKIVDEWRYQPEKHYSKRINLRGGQYYTLRVEYFQGTAPTRAFLGWTVPNQEPERSVGNLFGLLGDEVPKPIPTRYLFTQNPEPRPAISAAAPPKLSATVAPAPVAAKAPVTPVAAKKSPEAAATRPAPQRKAPVRARSSATLAADLNTLGTLPAGAVVALDHLYFEQSQARLLPGSLPEMERLAQILKDNPKLRLEIAGHTDNVGDSLLNQQLSQRRAEAVRDYLVRQGIEAERLLAVGYGGTRPVVDNNDAQQRPRNRRVEAVVR